MRIQLSEEERMERRRAYQQEYQKRWRSENRDKFREYCRTTRRRAAQRRYEARMSNYKELVGVKERLGIPLNAETSQETNGAGYAQAASCGPCAHPEP